jgi:very-short-patch-repair endonuclease
VARGQHELITHDQLEALGYSGDAIKHRIRRGRLHPIHRGVYAVGHPNLTQEGKWMAAVLACGDTAALSHDSAAELWRLTRRKPTTPIHVSSLDGSRSRTGIEVHHPKELNATTHEGVRVTTPAQTLIDIAHTWPQPELEQAIGEADLRRLVGLRALQNGAIRAGRRGAPLRRVIERVTFRVTQSELEREFLRLLVRAGLPLPESQKRFGKHRVDFWWPDMRLVVETDGGAFHRTAAQQTADARRGQEHIRAGRFPMRITHGQIFHDAAGTTALLVDVVARLN